jgi:hypothetical protein
MFRNDAMKTIVILKPKQTATFQDVAAILPREEPVLWSYIVSGECRAIHYDESMAGAVVLEFETSTRERVKELVSAFPLVAEGIHIAEYHALAPYTGLSLLFETKHGFHPALPEAWSSLR